jgi:hypothetical protein
MPFKVFTAGDGLPASDGNTFLMEQMMMVFSGSAARASVITSPVHGMFSFLKDSNTVEYFDGSDWTVL